MRIHVLEQTMLVKFTNYKCRTEMLIEMLDCSWNFLLANYHSC